MVYLVFWMVYLVFEMVYFLFRMIYLVLEMVYLVFWMVYLVLFFLVLPFLNRCSLLPTHLQLLHSLGKHPSDKIVSHVVNCYFIHDILSM